MAQRERERETKRVKERQREREIYRKTETEDLFVFCLIVLLLQYKDLCDFNNFIKRFNTIYDTSIREKCISHVFSFNSF